ncbi:uncharacterized protein J3R85_018001, partial [Psidium guajava]
MAASMATSSIIGLGSSSLPSPRKAPLVSDFVRSPVSARNPLKLARASGGRFTCFQRDWLRADYSVIGFGLIGWLAPSSVPLINGKSLTGLFFESIGAELAHFPRVPRSLPRSGCGWSHGMWVCSCASRSVKSASRGGPRSTF